jgi:hypothetical protein
VRVDGQSVNHKAFANSPLRLDLFARTLADDCL